MLITLLVSAELYQGEFGPVCVKHVRRDGQGSHQQTPRKGRAGQTQPPMPGLRCPIPRRTANAAGESQAEHRSASIRMQEGFSQQLLCCRAMPRWWGGMLLLPDAQALRCPHASQAAGRWQLLPRTFILSLKKMLFLPFVLLLFYSQALLTYL